MLGRILQWVSAPLFAATTGKGKPAKKIAKPKAAAKKTPPAKKPARPAKPVRISKTDAAKPAGHGKPVQVPNRKGQPPPPATVPQPKPAKPKFVEPERQVTPPAGRAILLAPENEKYADSATPKFRWLSVGGATQYEIIWSEDANLSHGRSVVSVATEAIVPSEQPLRLATTYYWRVRGGNETGWGPWSAVSTFRVLDETT